MVRLISMLLLIITLLSCASSIKLETKDCIGTEGFLGSLEGTELLVIEKRLYTPILSRRVSLRDELEKEHLQCRQVRAITFITKTSPIEALSMLFPPLSFKTYRLELQISPTTL